VGVALCTLGDDHIKVCTISLAPVLWCHAFAERIIEDTDYARPHHYDLAPVLRCCQWLT
jgi:hypothetical protein